MEKSFEYIKVQTAMDSFNVPDIGNVILQTFNDMGLEWYLKIETEEGYTSIKEFGPLMGDNKDIPKNNFYYTCERKEYNEKTITKTINNFLNNPRREITQAMEINIDDFYDRLQLVKDIL